MAKQTITTTQINPSSPAWQDWTPSFTNFTKGSATITAKYLQIGKTVNFRLKIKLSGSTMGTNPAFTLPVTAVSGSGDDEGYMITRNVRLLDNGIAEYEGHCRFANGSTTTANIYYDGISGSYVARGSITATVPFTWGNTDCIFIYGMYEAE